MNKRKILHFKVLLFCLVFLFASCQKMDLEQYRLDHPIETRASKVTTTKNTQTPSDSSTPDDDTTDMSSSDTTNSTDIDTDTQNTDSSFSSSENTDTPVSSSIPEKIRALTPQSTDSSLILSKYGVCYNLDTNSLIYASDWDAKDVYPVITAPFLVCLTALEHMSTDSTIVFGSEANLLQKATYATAGLVYGSEISLVDAITAVLVGHGYNASYAIAVTCAREVSGDSEMSDSDAVDFFTGLMTAQAEKLGMTETNFTNIEGIPGDDQTGSLQDMLILFATVSEHSIISPIVAKSSTTITTKSGKTVEIESASASSSYLDIELPQSGFFYAIRTSCDFAGLYEKNGSRYIVLVIDAPVERIDTTTDAIALMNLA